MPSKKLFGQLLVEAGLITPAQLDSSLKEQKTHGGRLGFHLVKLGYITPEKLTAFLKESTGVGLVHETLSERQKAAEAIPRHLALYYKIAPLKLTDRALTIGVSTMEHPNLLHALEEVTGCRIDPMIYPENEIRSLVDSSYAIPSELGVELFSFSENIFTLVDNKKKLKPLTPNQLKNERDIGEWLRSIVAEAIKEKSREILIKPEADGASVSFRKETFFLSDYSLTSSLHDDLTFMLFRLAKLDPLQQQKPQHGRFLVRINDRKVLMIVSAYPTIYGIRFMLEMFDEKLLRNSFDELTTNYQEMRMHLDDFILRAQHGMLIITGPEGSGRTTFLYSYLAKCKEEFQHIITLENAVRYPMSGLSQTPVEEAEMENALENVLKQKPDLVAVNSIRNVRSAELAFLVASRVPMVCVLSSYDCFVALEWLCRHNLKSPIKAGLLYAVISPRNIPRTCPHCSIPFEFSPEQKKSIKAPDGTLLKMNPGCDFCKNPDNNLSEMIFEFIRVNRDISDVLEKEHNSSRLRQKLRKNGKKTLYDVALSHGIRGRLDMVSVQKLASIL